MNICQNEVSHNYNKIKSKRLPVKDDNKPLNLDLFHLEEEDHLHFELPFQIILNSDRIKHEKCPKRE